MIFSNRTIIMSCRSSVVVSYHKQNFNTKNTYKSCAKFTQVKHLQLTILKMSSSNTVTAPHCCCAEDAHKILPTESG